MPREPLLDRRSFVAGLRAIGALPPELQSLPETEVATADGHWTTIRSNPLRVGVVASGALDLTDYAPRLIRADAFDFGHFDVATPDNLAAKTYDCEPVYRVLAGHYAAYRARLIAESGDGAARRSIDAALPPVPAPADLAAWLNRLDARAFSVIGDVLLDWAQDEVDWASEGDDVEYGVEEQDWALRFFCRYVSPDTAFYLGVQVASLGDWPERMQGAVLTLPVELANARAAAAGIPIVFVPR